MLNSKLTSLESFPRIILQTINGHIIELTNHSLISDWTMVIIYRGHHSKNCTEFLNLLNSFHQQFADIGITIIAASADNREQLQQHLKKLTVSFPIACELSVEHMYQLNLHLSMPKDFHELTILLLSQLYLSSMSKAKLYCLISRTILILVQI